MLQLNFNEHLHVYVINVVHIAHLGNKSNK